DGGTGADLPRRALLHNPQPLLLPSEVSFSQRTRSVKFRCERGLLVDALSTVSRAVASRSGGLLVLSGVRLELTGERLRLAGSDLDLSIEVEVSVAGEADGVAVVPARLATDIVRALDPGAVRLEVDNEDAAIAAGRSQFTVRTLPAEEFPRLP